MKKTCITLLLLLLGIYAVAQDAESSKKLKVSGGPKVEANFAKFSLSKNAGITSSMRLGITTGGFLQLNISRRFAVQVELLYHFKNTYIGYEGDNSVRYWGMEIPVYAMYVWNCGNGHNIYIGAGPFTEFGFSATAWLKGEKTDLYAIDEQQQVSAMRDSNTGFAFIAGYEMPCGLQFNVTYKVSISNVLDANSNQVGAYPMTTSIGVAYRFGKIMDKR